MNGVDLIILIILAIGFISGLARGIVRTLFGLAALVLGVVAAAGSFGYVATGLFGFLSDERMAEILAFILVFLIVFCLIALIGRLLSRVVKIAALGWVDRLAGGVAGIILASIVAGVLLLLAVLGGFHKTPALALSNMAPRVLSVTDAIVTVIPENFRDGFEEEYRTLRSEWEEARLRARTRLV